MRDYTKDYTIVLVTIAVVVWIGTFTASLMLGMAAWPTAFIVANLSVCATNIAIAFANLVRL